MTEAGRSGRPVWRVGVGAALAHAEMQRLMAGGIDNTAALLHQMTWAWDEASVGFLDGPAARSDEG